MMLSGFDEPPELCEFIEEHGGYWEGEHPDFPLEDWKLEVRDDNTRLSYWEWAFCYVQRENESRR